MALTPDQLAEIRRMISEPTQDAGWSDDDIAAIAENNLSNGIYDLRATASAIWEMKAASYVTLASVSESGSSRSLNQIFDHAQAMANYFKKGLTDTESLPAAPRSARIVRPTRGV